MKVAILIGISKYEKLTPLPGCKADLVLMEELLRKTDDYSEILSIGEDTNSSKVKRKVSEWIENLIGKEVNEVFFYYTGHGVFQNEEFYFCCSDFDKNKFNTTGITNSEIDEWLRNLNATLAIKVIDACQSGIQYVKDSEIQFLTKLKGSNPKSFKNCYFMFSSQNDQSSYQDDKLSFFTKAFALSIKDHQEERIRYRDIIDYISDYFVSDGSQKPHFVMDASSTEEFCFINEDLKQFLNTTSLLNEPIETTEVIDTPALSLKEIVASDASKFCNEEEVSEILEELKIKVSDFNYNNEFTDLYETKITFEQGLLKDDAYGNPLPNVKQIGEWLSKNNHEYFAKHTYKTVSYTEKVRDNFRNSFTLTREPSYYTETRTRNVISGLEITAKFPFDTITIIAEPKYLNLLPFECVIVLVLSKKEIRFFYYYADFRELNWKDRKIESNVSWLTSKTEMKDRKSIWKATNNIQNNFVDFVLEETQKRFGLAKDLGENDNS